MDLKICANVTLDVQGIDFWFSYIQHPNNPNQEGWRLHDIRLSENDTDLNWYNSLSEATMRFAPLEVSVRKPNFQSKI